MDIKLYVSKKKFTEEHNKIYAGTKYIEVIKIFAPKGFYSLFDGSIHIDLSEVYKRLHIYHAWSRLEKTIEDIITTIWHESLHNILREEKVDSDSHHYVIQDILGLY